jgi:predicted membrane protein (TIGR00267 family)
MRTPPLSRFYIVAGFCDGILTALTLGSGRLFDVAAPMSFNLAWRVAAAGGVPGALIFCIAHYAQLRAELARAERQLNILTHGHLATTKLHRAVLQESVMVSIVGGICSFVGAMFPLSIGAIFPWTAWVAVAASIIGLAILGVCLARSVHGSALKWAVMLVLSGAGLTFIGCLLKIA